MLFFGFLLGGDFFWGFHATSTSSTSLALKRELEVNLLVVSTDATTTILAFLLTSFGSMPIDDRCVVGTPECMLCTSVIILGGEDECELAIESVLH